MSDFNSSSEPRIPLIVALCFALGTVFFVNEQNFDLALGRLDTTPQEYRAKSFTADPNDTEDAIEQGSNLRRIAFPALGAIGLMLLFLGRRPVEVNGMLLALITMLFLWCIASIGWSKVPNLTAKRLVVLTASLVGIFGVAKAVTLRELTLIALGISSAFLFISFALELKMGVFTPWVGLYRFAGIVHPNTQASYCALMLMSSFAMFLMSPQNRTWYGALMLIAFVFLALTKSRSTLAGVTLAMFGVWIFITSRERRTIAFFVAPLVLIAGVGFFAVSGQFSSDDFEEAAQLGREGEASLGGLNGRIPLWIYCFKPISESPLFGYGYDSFWVPQQIHKATAALEWTVPNSHNVLIETQLNLGLVGSTLFILISVGSMIVVVRRLIHEQSPALALPAMMGLYAAVNAFFEASFSQPTGVDSFLTCCAVTIAAVLPSQVSEADASSPSHERQCVEPPQHGWGRPSYRL